MRLVTWEDEDGFVRQSYVPDGMPDSMAESGVPHEPPDLREIDWLAVAREINNSLVAQGLITWQDVLAQQTTLVPIITGPVKRQVQTLYRKKHDT